MIISMKKHLSVLGLFIRSSLFPVLSMIVLMGAVEVLFFHIELSRALTAHTAGIGVGFPSLERLLDRSAVNVYFALAFVLTTAILCLPGCAFRSKTQYTVARLSVTETAVTLWQAVCNILMYLLLASVQTLIAYGLCQYYMAAAPAEFTSTQTVFLAFYRHELLHALLPLADAPLWIRNGLLVTALAASAAAFPLKQRAGKISVMIVSLATIAIVFFERGIGEFGQIAIHACVLLIAICELLGFMLTRSREEADEDE